MRRWGYFLALPIALFLIRIGSESKREYMMALAIRKQNVEESIVHFERAAHAHVPGLPYGKWALEELSKIGKGGEEKDPKLSLQAYESMRAAVFSVRSFYSPYEEWLADADQGIARLRAGDPKSQKLQQFALSIREGPKASRIWMVDVGFLGWIMAVVGLILRGFTPQGILLFRRAIIYFGGVVGFFALWVLGLILT